MNKRRAGDVIPQPCSTCGQMFNYVYPGHGRPTWHACPDCKRRYYTVGTIHSAICKTCGAEFEFVAGMGKRPDRCETCRSIKPVKVHPPSLVGTDIQQVCETCGKQFYYTFRNRYHRSCPACVTILKRKKNTEWSRERRGSVAMGTELIGTCAQCGTDFSYALLGKRRRTLCDNCYSEINLAALEKMRAGPDTWNRAKWRKTLDAFGHVCAYCGCRPDKFHRDHFIPKALGGFSDIGNIVPSCPSCNLRKNSKHPADLLSPELYSWIVSVLEWLQSTQFIGLSQ